MAYKRYIKRGGKLYGPYVYSSHKKDGKVISTYIGKHSEVKNRDSQKNFLGSVNFSKERKERKDFSFRKAFFIGFISVFFLLTISLLINLQITGQTAVSVNEVYTDAGILKGNLSLVLHQSELLPSNTQVIINNSGSEHIYALNELLSERQEVSGEFYIDEKSISGNGLGYSISAERFPAVNFVLGVYEEVVSGGGNDGDDETPAPITTPEDTESNGTYSIPDETIIPESSSEPVIEIETSNENESSKGISGKSILDYFRALTGKASALEFVEQISGNVRANESITYTLNNNYTVQVSSSEQPIELQKQGNDVIVTTNYTGNESETIKIDLEKLNLSVVDGSLVVTFVYNNEELFSASKELGAEVPNGTRQIPLEEIILPEGLNESDNITRETEAECDEYLTACKTTGWVAGRNYCLSQNVGTAAAGDCFYINNTSVGLNCQGYNITAYKDTTSDAIFANSTAVTNVTIQNCVIYNASIGVYTVTVSVNNWTVKNNTFSNLNYWALDVNGSNWTVRDNIVDNRYGSFNDGIIIRANSVNMTILNNTFEYPARYGVYPLGGNNHTRIINNTFRHLTQPAINILTTASNNLTIYNNTFYNISASGFYTNIACTLLNISKNYFNSTGSATLGSIDFVSSGVNISHNVIENSRSYGITSISGVNHNHTIYNNTINNATLSGIHIYASDGISGVNISRNYINNSGNATTHGSITFNGQFINMSDNVIDNGRSYGIHFYTGNCSKNVITNNTINNSVRAGFYVGSISATIGNNISSNYIYNSGATYGAIHISDVDFDNNTIYNNYFNNTNNSYSITGADNWWNVTKTLLAGPNILGGPYMGGNYWDDYAGTDTDGDGIGDTNYTMAGAEVDYFPLTSWTSDPDCDEYLDACKTTGWANNTRYCLIKNVAGGAANCMVFAGPSRGFSLDCQGHTINATMGSGATSGIIATTNAVTNITIKNCIIYNVSYPIVSGGVNDNWTIENNTFSAFYYRVQMGGDNCVIRDNRFNNDYGPFGAGSDDCVYVNNALSNLSVTNNSCVDIDGVGVSLPAACTNCTVIGNTFANITAGVGGNAAIYSLTAASPNLVIYNNSFYNMPKPAVYSTIATTGAWNISKNIMNDTGAAATYGSIYLVAGNHNTIIWDNVINYSNTNGIDLIGSNNVSILRNNIFNSTLSSIYVGTTACNNLTIYNNTIRQTTEPAVYVNVASTLVNISNNLINDTGRVNFGSIYLAATGTDNAKIWDNVINYSNSYGIHLIGQDNVSIIRNTIFNSTLSSVYCVTTACINLSVYNNTIKQTTSPAVYVDIASNFLNISNNYINDTGSATVGSIAFIGSNATISGNVINNSNSYAINFADTAAIYADETISYNNISNSANSSIYTGTKLNAASNRSDIYSNRITDTAAAYWGLQIADADFDGNTIYNNYFNNTKNANLTVAGADNDWNFTKTVGTNIIGGPWLGGNYWDDYAGTDTDLDGIGNSNYVVNGTEIDYLPLVELNIAGCDEYVASCRGLSSSNKNYCLVNNVSSASATCFAVNADNILIDCRGYWIDGVDLSFPGITSTADSNVNVTNCFIQRYTNGISFSSTSGTISNNTFTGNANGVSLGSGSGPSVIEDNKFLNNLGYGVYLNNNEEKTIVRNNYIYNNVGGGGIILKGISARIYDNYIVVDGSSYGFSLSTTSAGNQNNTISHNIVDGNNLNGILIYSSSTTDHNTTIINNLFINSKNANGALWIQGDSNNISNNTFKDNLNGSAVRLTANANNNYVYNNKFIRNNNHSSDSGTNNYWNITKTASTNILGMAYTAGNYWDNYTGTDADGDGLGDTAYTFNTASDYLPLWNTAPNSPTVLLNGSGTDVINSDLTCWVNGTDNNTQNLIYSGNWYNGSSVFRNRSDIITGFAGNVYGLDTDSEGNYYFLVTNSTNRHFMTYKYYKNGSLAWNSNISFGNNIHLIKRLVVDSSGDVYSTGVFAVGSAYIWQIVKYDGATGTKDWNISFNSSRGAASSNSVIEGLEVDNNGGVYGSGACTITTTAVEPCIAKFNASNGDFIWFNYVSCSGSQASDHFYGIDIDSWGTIYAAGQCAILNITLSKFSSLGDEIWTDSFIPNDQGSTADVGVGNNDDIYVLGQNLTGSLRQIAIYNYLQNKTRLWNKSYNVSNDSLNANIPTDLDIDILGNLYVSGYVRNGTDFNQFVSKLDSNANLLWYNFTLFSGDDRSYRVAADNLGNVYTGGNIMAGANYTVIKFIDGFISSYKTPNQYSLAGTLNDSYAKFGEVWGCNASSYDGLAFSSYTRTNLTIINFPTHTTPILNSTTGNNYTTDNLTVYNQSTFDGDGDSVKNIINWKKNGVPIAVLNMPFEGGSNSTWTKDYSGYGNNGTVGGTTTYSSTGGYDGKGAYIFDAGAYTIIYTPIMDLGGSEITVTYWFKGDDYSSIFRQQLSGNYIIFPWGWGGNDTHVLSNDGGTDNGISVDGNSGNTLKNGQWHFVAVTWKQNTANGFASYLDGSLVAQRTSSNTPIPSIASNVVIGYYAEGESPTGIIDEVKVFNRSLSSQQIAVLYNNRTDRIVSEELSQGDVWVADITPNDGTYDGEKKSSNNLTILNAAPSMVSSKLNSSSGNNFSSDDLTCYGNATNVDNDFLDYDAFWYKNGEVYSSVAGLSQNSLDEAYWKNTSVALYPTSVVVDNSSNIYIVGSHFSPTNFTYIKYDSNGNYLFNATASQLISVGDIHLDSDNNVYLTGRNASSYIFTIKYNSTGSQVWNAIARIGYGGSGEGIDLDSSGNIYVTGQTNGSAFLLKYNSTGSEIWNKTYNGGGAFPAGYFYDLKVGSSGNIYAVGQFNTINCTLAKYDSSGNPLWNKTAYLSNFTCREVLIDGDENAYTGGDWNTGESTPNNLSVTKYDSSGNSIWNASFKPHVNSVLYFGGFERDSLGNIYVTARNNTLGSGTNTVWTVKLNSTGTPVWNMTYPKTGAITSSISSALTLDNNRNVVILGYDSTYGWLLKYAESLKLNGNPSGVQKNISTLNHNETTTGDNWSCSVRAFDGYDYTSYLMSNNLTILNSVPVMITALVNSSLGTNLTNENLTCWANATDTDADILNYTGYWYVNGARNISINASGNYAQGVLRNVSTLLDGNTTTGENWSCNVSAYDGIDYSSYSMSSNLTIALSLESCSVVFNTTSPVTYPGAFTVWHNCTTVATLYRNGTSISNNSVQTLGAGYWNFTVIRTNQQDYLNKYDTQMFTISKANPSGTLTNNVSWTVTYPTTVAINLSESNTGDGDVTYKVYRNGTDKGTGENVTLGYGTYSYVLNTTGGANYTANASMNAQTLTVNKNGGNCDVYFNTTSPKTYPASFIVYTNCTTGYALYRNGTGISNNSVQTLAAGYWNFTVIRTDTVNYTNIIDTEFFTISKANPSGTLTNNVSWTITYPTTVAINLSESNTGDGDVTYNVYRDGVNKNTGENWTPTKGTYSYVLNTTGGANYTANASMDVKTLTVLNAVPTQGTPKLNSTSGANTTADNLTVYNQSTADADGDSVKNIINWKRNGTSIAVLNVPFEGGSNASWTKDYSGFGNNGTQLTAGYQPVWSSTSGYDGKGAYTFDGADDSIDFGNKTQLNPPNITFLAWVKFNRIETASSVQNYIVSNSRDSSGTYNGYDFRVVNNTTTNYALIRIWNSTSYSINGGVNITPGVWYHMGFTYNGSRLVLYTNGAVDNSGSSTLGIGSLPSYNFTLGAMGMAPASYNMNGSLDDVLLFNRTLSAQEISAIYSNRTDLIVSQEIVAGDNWSGCITPNDGISDGSELCSANLTVAAPLANGQSCILGGQCTSGNCIEGVCCDTGCASLCESCLASKNGGSNGTCGYITGGTDPDDECTASGYDGCSEGASPPVYTCTKTESNSGLCSGGANSCSAGGSASVTAGTVCIGGSEVAGDSTHYSSITSNNRCSSSVPTNGFGDLVADYIACGGDVGDNVTDCGIGCCNPLLLSCGSNNTHNANYFDFSASPYFYGDDGTDDYCINLGVTSEVKDCYEDADCLSGYYCYTDNTCRFNHVVTLLKPTNAATKHDTDNIQFNFSVVHGYSGTPANCSLWGNFTGTWALNQTKATGLTNNTELAFANTLKLPTGRYIWNVQCIGSNDWGDSNFTLNVDETRAPNWSSNNTNAVNGTTKTGEVVWFSINWTDESALSKSIFSWNSTDSVTFTNVSYSCSGTSCKQNETLTLTGLTRGEKLCWKFYGNDTYNNMNMTPLQCFTVGNTLPNVTLVSPANAASTTNRTPTFVWDATDADGDTMTYEINLTMIKVVPSVCSDSGLGQSGISIKNYTPTNYLKCLYDNNGDYYNWSVRASDDSGSTYGNWSSSRTLNISSLVAISMPNKGINFGTMIPLGTNNTTTNNPIPFTLQNDGNCLINTTINATQFFTAVSGTTDYFKYKIDNKSGEEGSFNWSASKTAWQQMPIITPEDAIINLNWSDSRDICEIDLYVLIPGNETPGAHATTIYFTSRLSE